MGMMKQKAELAGWAQGKNTRASWRGPASEGSRLPSRKGGGPERPWHQLLPPPAWFCPSLPLQSSLLLQAELICCLLQEVPLVSMGCSHCLPQAHPAPGKDLPHCFLSSTHCFHCVWGTDHAWRPLLAPLYPPRQ